MTKLLIAFSLLLASTSVMSWEFSGFTKGNKCVQAKDPQGKRHNFCQYNPVIVHVRDTLGTSNKVTIVSLGEDGAMLTDGKTSKYYKFGSFSLK